ncbi:MAG: hypothetical protein IIA45_15500, partial [Bacteroidetes bacterium]|nr:hypothetical protein [Bacteroidota bacterium]
MKCRSCFLSANHTFFSILGKIGFLTLSLYLALCLNVKGQGPDLPSPAANIETIPMGSYVIAMDNDNQSIISPFNLKAYGLANELLQND